MGMKYDREQAEQQMNDNERLHQEEAGAAIDSEELQSLAAEFAPEPEAEQGGELADREGPTTAEVIHPLISFGCDLACPKYQIQPAEKQALADGYADLIDKYFPEGIGAFGVELNALLVTAAIFGPRVAKGIPARAPEKREKEPEGETATDEN